jgi:hypothetical protein
MSSFSAAALWYAGLGVSIFPVHGVDNGKCACGADPCGPDNRSAGKHPVPREGFKAATADRKQVEMWWRENPNANIGSPDFDVVDVDEYREGAREAFGALRPLIPKDTPFTRTGGGGKQLFFTGGTLRGGSLGIGIDSRYATRNYVILPPSRHRSGGVYEWGTDLFKGRLAPAPAFPLTEIATGEGDDLKDRVREGEIIETGRNKAAFRFACSLSRWSDDEALIRDQTQMWVDRHCRDPHEVDVAKQVRGALKLGRGESLGEALACPVAAAEAPPNREPRRRVVAVPASAIRREAVEWLELGRVPLGMVTVLGGIGGLGKSTLTCLWAARNAGVTLIATAEDSPETTVRPRLEAAGADLDRVHFVLVRTPDGTEDGIAIPDDVSQLDELVTETTASLVVVDPLVAHLPGRVDAHRDQMCAALSLLSIGLRASAGAQLSLSST